MSEVKTTLFDLARKLEASALSTIDEGRKQGADRIKIAASTTIEKRLVVESKEFTLANTLETQKVGLLVHKDQRKGSASLNNVQEQSLRRAVSDAIALAKFSVPDEFLVMPSPGEAPKTNPLPFMWNDKTSTITLGELQEFSQALLSRLTRDPRVSLDRLEVSTACMWHGLYNSNGVHQAETQSTVSWSFMGMAVDGDEVSGFDYDGRSVYAWDNALDLALTQCDHFVEKIIKNLRPIKAPTYKGPVLLTPRAVEELLIGTILYHMAGSSVMDGKSDWEKKIGTQVVSKLIHLVDSPHDEQFSGATAFDGDGLATMSRVLLNNGVLMTHLHDCYTANRCKAKSTATSGGPFALSCRQGVTELSTMQQARSELLVVDRFSGNIDPIKGTFSGVAKSSRYMKDGKDMGAVSETMIAGNVFELCNHILAVSNVTENLSGSILMPWMLVDGVSVTGN